jgi:hypothetical protein
MPRTARARGLITTATLPVLLAPPVALVDDTLPTAAEGEAAIHGTFNNGENVTRPRNLFQVRQLYQRAPDAEGREPEKWVTTLRADLWTGFGDGWKLYGRVDEPLVYSDEVTSPFNPTGTAASGRAIC